jgi:hypothetical protein
VSNSRFTHDLELKLVAVDLHGDWIWMPCEWAIQSIRLGFRVGRDGVGCMYVVFSCWDTLLASPLHRAALRRHSLLLSSLRSVPMPHATLEHDLRSLSPGTKLHTVKTPNCPLWLAGPRKEYVIRCSFRWGTVPTAPSGSSTRGDNQKPEQIGSTNLLESC